MIYLLPPIAILIAAIFVASKKYQRYIDENPENDNDLFL